MLTAFKPQLSLFPFCPVSEKSRREDRSAPFFGVRVSSHAGKSLYPGPAPTHNKDPNQSPLSDFSSHLPSAQEASCAPRQSLRYVSNTSSHTLWGRVDVISLNMQPHFKWDPACSSRMVL